MISVAFADCAPQIFDPKGTDPVAGPLSTCGMIVLSRIVLRLLADLAGLVVLSLRSRRSRRRIGERLGVRVRSVLGGLHHEYLLVPALA